MFGYNFNQPLTRGIFPDSVQYNVPENRALERTIKFGNNFNQEVTNGICRTKSN